MKIRIIAASVLVVLSLVILYGCSEPTKVGTATIAAISPNVSAPRSYDFGPYLATTSTLPSSTLIQFGIVSGRKNYSTRFSIPEVSNRASSISIRVPQNAAFYANYNQQTVTADQWVACGSYGYDWISGSSNVYTYFTHDVISNAVLMSDNGIFGTATGLYWKIDANLYIEESGEFALTNNGTKWESYYDWDTTPTLYLTNRTLGVIDGVYADAVAPSPFTATVGTELAWTNTVTDWIVTNIVNWTVTNFAGTHATSVTIDTTTIAPGFNVRSDYSGSWFRVRVTETPSK